MAFWFCDRALNDNEYLQPGKLQSLLYLSQAYYATAYNGKKLVPAIFVADETDRWSPLFTEPGPKDDRALRAQIRYPRKRRRSGIAFGVGSGITLLSISPKFV